MLSISDIFSMNILASSAVIYDDANAKAGLRTSNDFINCFVLGNFLPAHLRLSERVMCIILSDSEASLAPWLMVYKPFSVSRISF